MIKLFSVIAAGLLATSLVAYAGDGHGKHRERHFEKMAQELQLSDDQRQQVQNIVAEQRGKGRQQMEALHAETRERLATVLDDSQLQKFDAISEKKHKRMRKHFRDGTSKKGERPGSDQTQ